MKFKQQNLAIYAMAIALTLLFTWAFSIPAIVNNGYINLGDVAILLTSLIFGPIAGMIAGAIGSSLADLLLGFTVYAPFTFIVKGIEGYLAGILFNTSLKKYPFIACLISTIFMIIGYFITDYILYGLGASIANIPGNSLQAIVASTLATIIYNVFSRSGALKSIKK